MNIAALAVRQARAASLITLTLVVAGAIAAFALPSSIYPPLEFPRIVIIAHSGTLPPQSMMLTVTRPIETCDRLYSALGVRWSEDGKFEFKVKPYGSDRLANTGVEDKDFIRIGAQDVSGQIDASVLRGETERLSETQRRAIWDLTGTAAAGLGYTAAGSAAALA